jgi:hypothetical protein
MRKFDLKAKRTTIPELAYQTGPDGKVLSPIPYIETKTNDPMPVMLFVEEAFDTGEMEVGDRGSPEPIFEFEIHQYLNMRAVKEVLTKGEYERVRVALGMDKTEEAKKKGEEILRNVEKKIDSLYEAQRETQPERVETFKTKLETLNEAAKEKGSVN